MRFLIAMKSKETSRQTLQFGALMASRLSTDITVLYVEHGPKRSMSQEMQMAREKMNEWRMGSTGFEVLSFARDHLMSMGLIKPHDREDPLERIFSTGGLHRVEMKGEGAGVQNIAFSFREGDALEEIVEEMHEQHHELLVIGEGENRDFLINILKFSPSSILIVKNPRDIRYRILVATDASPPAHRAELLAIKTASYLKMELTFLTVVDNDKQRELMERHLKRMSGVCEMKKVPYRIIVSSGNVVKATVDEAGDDHIIFLGRSRRKPLTKLLLGSKTISIASTAKCPLLVMK